MWVSVNSVLGMSERVSDLLVHFVLLYILLSMRLHSVRNKLYIYSWHESLSTRSCLCNGNTNMFQFRQFI